MELFSPGLTPSIALRPAFYFGHVVFMWRGGDPPKMHHLRTSPKLHMVWTAWTKHQNNQIAYAYSPNQRTWQSFNTYVFLRTLYLENKSTCNPKFCIMSAHKIILQCYCKKLQHKTEINRNEPKSNTICAGIGEKRQNVRKRLKVLWEEKIDRGAHHSASF